MQIDSDQLAWFRLRRSGLVDPFPSPVAAARALVGIQAQMLPAAGLALWNRTPKLDQAAFESLLYRERSLVKLWGQRATLHLYPSDEWPLIHGALQDDPRRWSDELRRVGADVAAFEVAAERVIEMLHRQGELCKSDLPSMTEFELPESLSFAHIALLRYAVIEGQACLARPRGSESLFVHRKHWLPDLVWDPPPPEVANPVLARRYLGAYGPAMVHDLAYWRKSRITDTRRWLKTLGEELVELDCQGRALLALSADLETLGESPPPRQGWPVRLLYRFDPLLLGTKDKDWLIDPAFYKRVWRRAGHIEGALLAHGRLQGTWLYRQVRGGLRITVTPFAPLPEHVRAALQTLAPAVARFFGLPLADLVLEAAS